MITSLSVLEELRGLMTQWWDHSCLTLRVTIASGDDKETDVDNNDNKWWLISCVKHYYFTITWDFNSDDVL